ncbi:MAG: ATP synthase F0 subunit C [Epsilonproteobacteria bacterium]|nr:ATP synthase F0 subunit C [Campylobacterota bacterium]
MEDSYAKAAVYIGAALAMGLGSVGPALGQGLIGMKACESIGKHPESASNIKTTMIMALSLVETSAIYCFIVSLILMVKFG